LSAARQSRAAAQDVLQALGIVTDCAIPRRLVVQLVGEEPDVVYTVAFGPNGNPVSLPAKAGGPSGLLLKIRHSYAIVREDRAERGSVWRATTRAYQYAILDSLERELLVYHWHLGDMGGPEYPHLHVSAALEAQSAGAIPRRLPLDKRHLPTGLVSLASVVRLLIAEFGIAYRHRDWASRLDRAERLLGDALPERH
jgi:hypothetical protein